MQTQNKTPKKQSNGTFYKELSLIGIKYDNFTKK